MVETPVELACDQAAFAARRCQLKRQQKEVRRFDVLPSRKWGIASLLSHEGALHIANRDVPTHQAASTCRTRDRSRLRVPPILFLSLPRGPTLGTAGGEECIILMAAFRVFIRLVQNIQGYISQWELRTASGLAHWLLRSSALSAAWRNGPACDKPVELLATRSGDATWPGGFEK